MSEHTRIWLIILLLASGLYCLTNAAARDALADPTAIVKSTWPPAGEPIRAPVTRDAWVSAADGERDGNNGGATKLKAKGQQEYILLDIDPAPFKGKIITGALLHIRSASPRKAPFARLGVSTAATEWGEGRSSRYRPEKGGASFNQAAHGIRDWAHPGSTIMEASFGRGGTIWKFAEASPPDPEGWQRCAVDADVVAARAAGLSRGFLVADEVGHTWSLDKGAFEYTYFPNRWGYSRESRGDEPWMEVWVNGEDAIPPEPVSEIRVEVEGLPRGEALVRWATPKDHGGGKTLGFHVAYVQNGQEKEAPRYMTPMAGGPGEEVAMHIRGLSCDSCENMALTVRPVDSAGNVGKPFTREIVLSPGAPMPEIPEVEIEEAPREVDLPGVGDVTVSVVDLLDKVDPVTGLMTPPRKKGYKGANHLFSAKEKTIRLQAARNETVAFQLILEGRGDNLRIDYSFENHGELETKRHQFAYVAITDKNGRQTAILPDPLLPVDGVVSIPSASGRTGVPGQTSHALICELYVPHQTPPGRKSGLLTIATGSEQLTLTVDLLVWNFTLPDKLSFVPEMNAYNTASPYKGYDYYRLAHEHRTCLNRLPYGWHGQNEFAPEWSGSDFDWAEWDKHVAPLLDGSAFSDLPRKNEPVDFFYLPFNENWPVDLFKHYTPSYWADEAFGDAYKNELQRAFRSCAEHVREKGWNETIFQYYLNNKIYYRKKFNRSSAPWVLDEPMNTQDFWALRWYGLLWKQAVEPVRGDARMWFRADVSYTQFSRNLFWNVVDLEYLGGSNGQKTRMKRAESLLWTKSYFAEYGVTNKIEDSNAQPALWCLSAWSGGAMGVLPWQTICGKNSWKRGEQTALFYPHPTGPKPSVRLKAYTRGQQDVEYLMLFKEVFRAPRHAIVQWLKTNIHLPPALDKGSIRGADGAGHAKMDASALWKMRYRLGGMISEKTPPYKRSLVHFETPRWKEERLPDIGRVSVAPLVESYGPDCDRFAP